MVQYAMCVGHDLAVKREDPSVTLPYTVMYL